MKTKEVRQIAAGLITDMDGALAGEHRGIEDRHSAAASAAILFGRLVGSMAISLARIAHATEIIADNTTPDEEDDTDVA